MVISIPHRSAVILCLVQRIFCTINTTHHDKLEIGGNIIVEDLEDSPIRVKIIQYNTEVVFEKFIGDGTNSAEAEGYVSYQGGDYLFSYFNGKASFRGLRVHNEEKVPVTV